MTHEGYMSCIIQLTKDIEKWKLCIKGFNKFAQKICVGIKIV